MAMTGCNAMLSSKTQTGQPVVVRGDNFVLVTVKAQDTFAALAKTYLNDADKAWWIKDYNQSEAIAPGQQLVIPLTPMAYGGLEAEGYQTVPVLLYSHLSFRDTQKKSVSAQQFEDQINYLQENDFETISLDQFYAFLDLQDQLLPNAVMITFDTAGRWVFDLAFPILKRHGMKAALFVPVEQIGHPGKLAWYQLIQMAAQGFSIGVHGPKIKKLHTQNASRTAASLNNYILQSKKSIERHLNQPCRDFSVPSQEMKDLSIALLKKHGFRTGFTRKRGQNPFFVHNFKIRRSVIYGQYNQQQFGQNLITYKKAQLR